MKNFNTDTPRAFEKSKLKNQVWKSLKKAGWDGLGFLKAKNKEGQTPLSFSILHCEKCVDGLLEMGADFLMKNLNGETPLMVALEHNKVQTAKKILSKYPNNSEIQKVNELSSIGDIDNDGHTALFYAAIYCPDLISDLVGKGADPNSQDSRNYKGNTILSSMIELKSPIFNIKELIKVGADIHQHNPMIGPPLFNAIEDYPELVPYLLESGVDINASLQNHYILSYIGSTPLMWAIRHSPELVSILLEGGADPNLKDIQGQSSWHLASEEPSGKSSAALERWNLQGSCPKGSTEPLKTPVPRI